MSLTENLSEEELKALHECANEAFFQRSLPLITIFGGGTYLAVRSGKLNPHYKWGATPKVMIACAIAYFIGQISYSQKCRQKLMDIPDSKYGKMLRRQELGMPGVDSLHRKLGLGINKEKLSIPQNMNLREYQLNPLNALKRLP